MKVIPFLLSAAAAVWLGCDVLPAQAQQAIPGPAYVRSTLGSPLGSSITESAFGFGKWGEIRLVKGNILCNTILASSALVSR
jgi:hypothetical protein